MWSRCRTSGTGWLCSPIWVPSILFIFWLGLRLWEALLSSLSETYHFLKTVVHTVTSDTTTTVSDRSTLAAQGGRSLVVAEEVVVTWRDEGTHWWRFSGHSDTRGDEEVLEEQEEMALWFIVTTVKSRPYEVAVPLLKGKPVRGAHVFATFLYDNQLRSQFEQF